VDERDPVDLPRKSLVPREEIRATADVEVSGGAAVRRERARLDMDAADGDARPFHDGTLRG
jgi:hypothetical protein